MPTKRTRREQASRAKLSPALLAQLELGHVPPDTPGRIERFFWGRRLEPTWRDFREPILAAWTVARPGSRPWAWWQYDAKEPRRCLAGASLLFAPEGGWIWRSRFGVRDFRRTPTREDGRMVVESEAAYLRRLGLLTREEKRGLKPAAFEPVELPLEASA